MSRPRTIGRLDAPGAKLEPVMPGLENNRSPNVPPALRLISSVGTTVTVANWSVTIGNVPSSGTSGGRGRRGGEPAPRRRAAVAAGAARSGSAR